MSARELRLLRPDSIPIHRLSTDILFIIFSDIRNASYFIEGPSAKKGKWLWISVTHVCRYWRTTALGAPSLWSQLYNIKDCRKMKTFIQRSKDADLAVFASVIEERIKGSFIEEFLCLTMALRNLNRIRHLCINIIAQESIWKQIQELLNLPAPRLKDVMIKGDRRRTIQLHQFAPVLRELELISFSSLSVASTSSSALLRRLQLCNITTLSLSEILSTLASCHDLEDLILMNVGLVDTANTSESLPRVTVSLPQLILFTVGFDEPYGIAHDELLCSIRTSRSMIWKVVYLTDRLQSFFDMKFLDAYLRNIPKCEHLNILISPTCLNLWCRLYKIFYKKGDIPPHCELSISWVMLESARVVRSRVESLIRASNWKDVRQVNLGLVLHEEAFEEEDYVALLVSLSSVEFLTITTDNVSLEDIEVVPNSTVDGCLRALAHQVTDGEVVCPRLKEFTLMLKQRVTAPEALVQDLISALRDRKRLELDLKKVHIICPQKINVGAISDFIEIISWLNSEA